MRAHTHAVSLVCKLCRNLKLFHHRVPSSPVTIAPSSFSSVIVHPVVSLSPYSTVSPLPFLFPHFPHLFFDPRPSNRSSKTPRFPKPKPPKFIRITPHQASPSSSRRRADFSLLIRRFPLPDIRFVMFRWEPAPSTIVTEVADESDLRLELQATEQREPLLSRC